MTDEQAIKLIKKHKPKSQEQFEDLGFRLKYLSCGAFREAFQLVGHQLVVKIPFNSDGADTADDDENLYHSHQEIKAYRRIMRGSNTILQAFMPEIYWYEKTTGIVLMKKYRTVKNNKVADVVFQMIRAIGTSEGGDVYTANLGYEDEDDEMCSCGECTWPHYVILDLGLF